MSMRRGRPSHAQELLRARRDGCPACARSRDSPAAAAPLGSRPVAPTRLGAGRPADRARALTASPAPRGPPRQQFVVTDTIIDRRRHHARADGPHATAGLPVIGGDLVVHQGPDGAAGAASARPSTAPLDLATTPADPAQATAKALSRPAATRDIAGCGRRASRAWSSTPPRAPAAPRLGGHLGGKHADGTPSRLSTYVDARTGKVLRREEHVQNVDGTGPVALQRHGPAPGDAVRVDVPAQGRRPAATPTRPT